MYTHSRPNFYRITSAYRRFHIDVGAPLPSHRGQRHRLYGEISGNPDGPVVLCLHGGPGAGSNPSTRQFFDPDHYCIIQFDQRGAGRSQPWASMEDNTTPDLVADIETIACHLELEDFILFGGSWGSTLALAYAAAYPKRVRAMVLRGIFLGRPRDIEWFLQGMEGVHPEAHATLLNHLEPHERTNAKSILNAYVTRLMSPDKTVAYGAAYAWSNYEDAAATIGDNKARKRHMAWSENQRQAGDASLTYPRLAQHAEHYALAIARAEAFYLQNNLFLPKDGLLSLADRWQHIPGYIVHGRYDMVCQAEGAVALANKWPRAELKILDDAGHSTFEDSIAKHLLATMENLKAVIT